MIYKKIAVMTIDSFIKYTKENPLQFIKYCEIIITDKGKIILPLFSSHCDAIVEYITKTKKISRETLHEESMKMECLPLEYLVDKYKFVACWYSGYLYSITGLSDKQQEIIELLQKEKLITDINPYIDVASEYTNRYREKEM